jgi:bloom syndrome protein
MASFSEAIHLVLKELKVSFELKEEQELAVKYICEGKHVFCSLPTGFGKSMIYALPPLILDKVRNTIDFSLTYFT